MTGYLKQSKVKQVMADLALTQVANRACDNITQSEYRRLMIGVQLIKDPGKSFHFGLDSLSCPGRNTKLFNY